MTGAANGRTGWISPGRAVVYWCTAGLGVVGGAISWLWLYLATEEATRGATPDRTGPNPNITMGVTGLIIGHLIGFASLALTARQARRNPHSAAWFAGAALVADSLIGMSLSLTLTGGDVVAPWSQPAYHP